MRSCANRPERLALVAAALFAAACTTHSANHGIRVERVDIEPGAQRLRVHLVQKLELSPEARDALQHGVPLTVLAKFEVRAADTRGPVAEARRSWEIRYLPLSEHYQLSEGDTVRTFPRLRHVVAALERLDTEVQTATLAAGTYTLRARVSLDRASLPAPMQLPAALSPEWRHDSLWSTWPFVISA